jgi:hypothetical protein
MKVLLANTLDAARRLTPFAPMGYATTAWPVQQLFTAYTARFRTLASNIEPKKCG